MLYIHFRFLNLGIPGEWAGFGFAILLFSLLGAIAGSLDTPATIGCRTLNKALEYWTNLRYWTEWMKTGSRGRSAGVNLICSLGILSLVLVCAVSTASTKT